MSFLYARFGERDVSCEHLRRRLNVSAQTLKQIKSYISTKFQLNLS